MALEVRKDSWNAGKEEVREKGTESASVAGKSNSRVRYCWWPAGKSLLIGRIGCVVGPASSIATSTLDNFHRHRPLLFFFRLLNDVATQLISVFCSNQLASVPGSGIARGNFAVLLVSELLSHQNASDELAELQECSQV